MSLFDCFKCLSQFISESVRFILFFASILFMVASVILLVFSGSIRLENYMLDVHAADHSSSALIVVAVYLILLSLLGIFATFFRGHTSIGWFALLTCLNVILAFALFAYLPPRLTENAKQIEDKLKQLQSNFDWTKDWDGQTDNDTDWHGATFVWNKVQSGHECCGIQGPNDWVIYRPISKILSNAYPASCCPEKKVEKSGGYYVCQAGKGLYEDGCTKRMHQYYTGIELVVGAMGWLNLLLCVMASTVIICRYDPEERRNYYQAY